MIKEKIKQVWAHWTTWEFMPMWLSNMPIVGFYLWYAAKARDLFFFSAANPVIPLGGAWGESKYDILRRMPIAYTPRMVFVEAGSVFDAVLVSIQKNGLSFPLIAKPDVGERGLLVKKITGAPELQAHLEQYPVDFILQELVSLPVEASVLCILFPGEKGSFEVTSVCVKEFLQITGNGKSTVRALIAANVRAAFQLKRLEAEFGDQFDNVLPAGAVMPLGMIGNHCLGTKFLNFNHLIDNQLVNSFEAIFRQIDGINYGRFDLKCASIDALKNGEIQILEFNGIMGEPAHVYDPSYGPWRAYRDFLRHWRLIWEVSNANRKVGVVPTKFKEGVSFIRNYLSYKKHLTLLTDPS